MGLFSFFSTFFPPFTNNLPIIIDYSESLKSKLLALKKHKSDVLVHSGNWWSMKNPEKRTPENVLEGVKKIYNIIKRSRKNARFLGFMSCNEQPEQPALQEKPDEIPYWMGKPDALIPYLLKCLENANWALKNMEIKTPLYCTLQVTNYAQAKEWFKKAYESGHRYFSIGVSEFLKNQKYRSEGIKRIFEIIKGIREVTDKRSPIHLSGLSSFNLIPMIKYLGATSCDGSTPVQSALAYGTIFNLNGIGCTASNLNELLPRLKKHPNEIEIKPGENTKGILDWFGPEEGGNECKCEICRNHSKKQRILSFNNGKKDYKAEETRVIHNLFVWRSLIREINLNMVKDPLKWLEKFSQKSNYTKKNFQLLTKIYNQ